MAGYDMETSMEKRVGYPYLGTVVAGGFVLAMQVDFDSLSQIQNHGRDDE